MENLAIYCLSLSNSHYKKIIDMDYIPVGLGRDKFSDGWLLDKIGENISNKNEFYGEYTFHYCLWKNQAILENHDKWIGFCTYRRFWSQNNKKNVHFNLNKDILKKIPQEWDRYDAVLVEPIFTNKTKLSKILKHGKQILIKKPFLFFNKKNITVKVHFDMYHGYGNLDKAIDLLQIEYREKFREYVNNEIMFNPYNMFICKSKKTLLNYYTIVFPWLKKCENIFEFKMGDSYGKKRIYGFLAERFLSYWFNNYTNPINWPVYFKDIS